MLKLNHILATIAVLLFPFNYWICECFYSDNLTKWWELRTNIYSFEFLVLFYLLSIGLRLDKYLIFIFTLACGLCVSDVIDRLWFNITIYTHNDYIFTFASILSASIKTYTYGKSR